MSYLVAPQAYNVAAAAADIPNSLSSSVAPRPINCQVQTNVVASTSGDQGQNGLISFQLPVGTNHYLKNNTVYLRLRCRLNKAANLTNNVTFSCPSKSASALIKRLDVNVGNVSMPPITEYWLLHETLLTHSSSYSFYINDSKVMQYTGEGATFSGASKTVDVVIPVLCPLLNGSSNSLPLFALNGSPIQLNFGLNSTLAAFDTVDPNADLADGFTISEARLVYETIQVDADFVQQFKMMLAQGNLYQLPFINYYIVTAASQSTLNYNVGTSFSSLRSVLWTNVRQSFDGTTDVVLFHNGQSDCKVFLDGRLINNNQIKSVAETYAEMNKCLGRYGDPNVTSFLLSRDDYYATKFLSGVNCNRVDDSGMVMTGSPCNMINLYIEHANVGYTQMNTHIILLHDNILTVDAAGSCVLVK